MDDVGIDSSTLYQQVEIQIDQCDNVDYEATVVESKVLVMQKNYYESTVTLALWEDIGDTTSTWYDYPTASKCPITKYTFTYTSSNPAQDTDLQEAMMTTNVDPYMDETGDLIFLDTYTDGYHDQQIVFTMTVTQQTASYEHVNTNTLEFTVVWGCYAGNIVPV